MATTPSPRRGTRTCWPSTSGCARLSVGRRVEVGIGREATGGLDGIGDACVWQAARGRRAGRPRRPRRPRSRRGPHSAWGSIPTPTAPAVGLRPTSPTSMLRREPRAPARRRERGPRSRRWWRRRCDRSGTRRPPVWRRAESSEPASGTRRPGTRRRAPEAGRHVIAPSLTGSLPRPYRGVTTLTRRPGIWMTLAGARPAR